MAARLDSTAVHEAGHAVITIREGCTFSHATIEPRGRTSGAVHDTATRPGDDEDVRIKLAGVMAQRMCMRRWHHGLTSGAEGDLIGVGQFFRENERVRELLDWNIEATQERLLQSWSAVVGVARGLVRKRRLVHAEVRELVSAARSAPRLTPPGVLTADMWDPLRERVEWHIANPGGIDGMLARLRSSASSETLP